ncbi:MAG: ABC transporter substrate-binding protein [Proteobacteria bacterium]|nr:ABC transporter substrate-binding protein [Pseudomonadota bacterium]
MLIAGLAAGPTGLAQPATEPLRVLVPDRQNLQFASLWIAQGAGFFAAEGVPVAIVTPPARPLTVQWLRDSRADVAVLPPPMYLALIGEGFAIRIVANLLRRDPINLVVSRSAWTRLTGRPQFRSIECPAARPVRSASTPNRIPCPDVRGAPVIERLRALRGMSIGVAQGPQPRLRALFHSHGLVVDDVVDVAIIPGPKQNAALAEGRVDALYAHTPFLERALLHQDAALYVNQSAGEVPRLAEQQIHTLVVTKTFIDQHSETVHALVRALLRAQRLANKDVARAQQAVRAALPHLPGAEVDRAIELYAPALPSDPAVSVAGVLAALDLYPIMGVAPGQEAASIAPFVATHVARAAIADIDRLPRQRLPRQPRPPLPESTHSTLWVTFGWMAGGVGVLLILLAAKRLIKRRF